MKRLRPLLSVVLGLLLLVQGFAVAAGQYPAFNTQESPAAAQVAMPCHPQVSDTTDKGRSCCDAGCPDMTSCALSHLATAPDVGFAYVPAQVNLRAEPVLPPASFTPQSPLRPPIVFHA